MSKQLSTLHVDSVLDTNMNSIDKHLSSMMASISKDVNTVYGAKLEILKQVLKSKYSEEDLMDYFDKKGARIYKTRLIKSRNEKQVKEKIKPEGEE